MILKLENSLTLVGKEPEDWSVAFGLLKFTNLYKKWFLRISNSHQWEGWHLHSLYGVFNTNGAKINGFWWQWIISPPNANTPHLPPASSVYVVFNPNCDSLKSTKTWHRGLIEEPPRWTKIKENTIIPTIPTIVTCCYSMIFVSELYYSMFCSPPWSWDLPVHEL